MLSKRGKQWQEFSDRVLQHIETYTIPQYGDMPDDQASNFELRDIVQNMRRYINRAETNQRGQEDQERDCLKIAHYACILLAKRREQ